MKRLRFYTETKLVTQKLIFINNKKKIINKIIFLYRQKVSILCPRDYESRALPLRHVGNILYK
jgi:hypothetical protein